MALIRGGKQATIRLGGVVDLPAVTVDIERFNFHAGFEVRIPSNDASVSDDPKSRDANLNGTFDTSVGQVQQELPKSHGPNT